MPVDDIETENIGIFFPEITATIHDSLTRSGEEGAVFVHCSRGASRSVSVVIAYLIRFHGFSYENGLEFVRRGRPEASPNPGFKAQLKTFERERKGQP